MGIDFCFLTYCTSFNVVRSAQSPVVVLHRGKEKKREKGKQVYTMRKNELFMGVRNMSKLLPWSRDIKPGCWHDHVLLGFLNHPQSHDYDPI
jgi:hypothetical protein